MVSLSRFAQLMPENGNKKVRNCNRLQQPHTLCFRVKELRYPALMSKVLLNVNLRKFVVFYKFILSSDGGVYLFIF